MIRARQSFLAIINHLWSAIANGFRAFQAYVPQVQKGQGSIVASSEKNNGEQDQITGSPATTYRVSSFISLNDRDSKKETMDDYERASQTVKPPEVHDIVAQVANATGSSMHLNILLTIDLWHSHPLFHSSDDAVAYPKGNSVSTNTDEGQPLAQALALVLAHCPYLFPRTSSAIWILNSTVPNVATANNSVVAQADNSNVGLALDGDYRMECHVRSKKGFYVVELPDTSDDDTERSKSEIEPDGDTAVQNGSILRTNNGQEQPLDQTLEYMLIVLSHAFCLMTPISSAIPISNIPDADGDTTTTTANEDNSELDGVESFLGIPFLLNFGTGISLDDIRQQNIVNSLDINEDEDVEPLPLYVEPPFYSAEGQGVQEQEDHTTPTPLTLSPTAAFDNFGRADLFGEAYQAPPPYGPSLSGFGSQEEDSLPFMWQNDDHDGLDIGGSRAAFQLQQQQSLGGDQWASTAYIEPGSSDIAGAQGDNLLGLVLSLDSFRAPLCNYHRHQVSGRGVECVGGNSFDGRLIEVGMMVQHCESSSPYKASVV